MTKKFLIILFFLMDVSISFCTNKKDSEIDLLTVYEEYNYNHCYHYIRLDTLHSKINVYKNYYGNYALSYSLTICPDSSIILNKIEETCQNEEIITKIRLTVIGGVIRNEINMDTNSSIDYFYDLNNHLNGFQSNDISILFTWRNDSLMGHLKDYSSLYKIPTDEISEKIVRYDSLCSEMKSPELINRLFEDYGFNTLIFSMLGLYGNQPIASPSYSVERRHIKNSKVLWTEDTKVKNKYSESGVLLESYSICNGQEQRICYKWNLENLKKVFDFRFRFSNN